MHDICVHFSLQGSHNQTVHLKDCDIAEYHNRYVLFL